MKNFVMSATVLTLLASSGCSLRPPRYDKCRIIGLDQPSSCTASRKNRGRKRGERYDKKLSGMVGWVCISPKSEAKARAYQRKVANELQKMSLEEDFSFILP